MNGFIKLNVAMTIAFVSTTTSYAQPTPKELHSEGYVQSLDQSASSRLNTKALHLNDVIEQGLRKNYDQQIRKYNDEILDLKWDDTWEDFWLPKVNISLISDEHRLGTVKGGSNNASPRNKRPDGALSLNFGDYTLFNWGRDYLPYLNTKADIKRSKEQIKEDSRELKHDLIIAYFRLSFFNEQERIKRDQLRHASFIYRLNREKISLKKVSKQDYYLARSEYLRAQNEFQEAKNAVQLQNEVVANLINDEVGTKYILQDALKYELLTTPLDEIIRIANANNPDTLDALKEVENAKRSYELALKNNLPLPKISMTLGAYDYRFGPNTNRTTFSTGEGNSNIDIVASINATWSLTGSGGLLNSRRTKSSMLSKHLAFAKKAQAQRDSKAQIKSQYFTVKHLQNQINILDARIPTLQKSFDTILENYMNKRTRYIDFKNTLIELTDAQILLEQSKFLHLLNKIELAKVAGVEDFPGQNFENLKQSKKGSK
ncbi:hypothetical protein BIY24_11935 [Halobacteriovorax marinus]|uniref:TolC family protein n=1 Tax=Halobacteriovorax marinus TaxID=97084 RepID=UPI000BC2D9DE|nr:TolC family protein [Halobacteriovorax marinus]ATH08629.1 hypothetical protein BIY24_11935 [Halobacteriovorax marinus]